MIRPKTIRAYNPPHDSRIAEIAFVVRNLNYATFIPRYEYRPDTNFQTGVTTMSIIDHKIIREIARISLTPSDVDMAGAISLIMPPPCEEDFVKKIQFNKNDNFSEVLANALKEVIPHEYHPALIVQPQKITVQTLTNN